MHVVNHASGKAAMGETRNVLIESARIARGKIRPVAALEPGDFDCVIFPGGFGAAKNLCDFATRGAEMSVDPDIERVVRGFHMAGKPVGMCCIAPVIGIGGFREASLKQIFGADLDAGAERLEAFLADLGVKPKFQDHGVPADRCASIIDEAFAGERGRNFVGSKENFMIAAEERKIMEPSSMH
jgi:enhancing lycopene biosynthesis protein 2